MPSNNLVDKIHITNEEAQAGYDEYDIGASASNVSATFKGESTDVQSALSELSNVSEINPDEVDFDYDDTTGDLALNTPVFKGTLTEWNALTSAEKAHYENGIVNINDNNEYVSTDMVVDTVAEGNMHAVTSNAVFSDIQNLQDQVDINTTDIGTLNSALTAYTFGTGINLASYVGAGNAYIFPSDGYLYMENTTARAGRGYLSGMRVGAQTSSATITSGVAIPVRKGMTFYVNDEFYNVTFYPLVTS